MELHVHYGHDVDVVLGEAGYVVGVDDVGCRLEGYGYAVV